MPVQLPLGLDIFSFVWLHLIFCIDLELHCQQHEASSSIPVEPFLQLQVLSDSSDAGD